LTFWHSKVPQPTPSLAAASGAVMSGPSSSIASTTSSQVAQRQRLVFAMSIDTLDARIHKRLNDDISDLGQHFLSEHLRLDASLRSNG